MNSLSLSSKLSRLLERVKMTVVRKKLIEVALPLEAINIASAREKSLHHGHPSSLHLWWARRPLAAARAVIFSQMVDDPSSYVDTLLGEPTARKAAEKELKSRLKLWEIRVAEYKAATGNEAVAVPEPGSKPSVEDAAADIERQRLFGIIEELVKWENTTNENVLNAARAEIWQSWRRACVDNIDHPRAKEIFDRHKLPAFHDPFAGGGALPLEAQRLGLEAYATDLNPVAVLINKAMIEIPPKFASRPPINHSARAKTDFFSEKWQAAAGLADDVRYYGQWMRNEAEKRIGQLYPKIEITTSMVEARPDLEKLLGQKLLIIAFLWSRTVKSPNPAFSNVDIPLSSTFMLCTKAGKEAYVEPVVESSGYHFVVRTGKPDDFDAVKLGTTMGKRAAFRCLMSGVPVGYDHIRAQGKAGLMSARLMAIVAEGERGRIYLSPNSEMEAIALGAQPSWTPETALPVNPRDFKTPNYGLETFGDLFTKRQLLALNTFSDLIVEVRAQIDQDQKAAAVEPDLVPLCDGGTGSLAYADAIAIYLGLTVNRLANRGCTISFWDNASQKIQQAFGRQAIPMTWDFCESNPFSESSGNWLGQLDFPAKFIEHSVPGWVCHASQMDAQRQDKSVDKVISTDPPYYDNIGYADLSDFFYVWLRRSVGSIYPDLFTTLAVPKSEELVATPYRHGGKEKAEAFFLDGMTAAMQRLADQAHPAFPTTIYYAYKQSETDEKNGTKNTGWDVFLEAVLKAGFSITGTWPVRTESTGNLKKNLNALASSIVLVCQPRNKNAAIATRREFLNALKAELPAALAHLQRSNIAPVDLTQASIGPGMAVYTRYSKVVDTEGKALSVHDAQTLINQTLDEVLSEQEGDFDADTRWALAWFEQVGFDDGEFGIADVLARAKVTSVAGLSDARIVIAKAGKVRLRKPEELDEDWDPTSDNRLTVWEIVHHLIRVLEADGEIAAAQVLYKIGVEAEVARELAYRLYTICERKKRNSEALSYNALVQSWPEINRLAQAQPAAPLPAQADMFQGA
jgi:putative DNA methylase